jgi:hypothetical protein
MVCALGAYLQFNVAVELALGGHPTPMQSQLSHVETIKRSERAGQHALLSAFIPGFGQAVQRRFAAAVVQFGTVAAYLAGALALGGRRALFLALCWNVWSVIDAYRHEAD